MATFVPSFEIAQSILNPKLVIATDDSSGDYGVIAFRRIYFQNSQGNYLVEPGVTTIYNLWPLANQTQNFNILLVDTAVNCTVEWCDTNGNIISALPGVFCLSEFNDQFRVYLAQQQALSPGILQDANYASNWYLFTQYTQEAVFMVERAADISSSQNLLNKATKMRQQEADYF